MLPFNGEHNQRNLDYEGRVFTKWHLPHCEVGDFQACTFSHLNNSMNFAIKIIINYPKLPNDQYLKLE